MRKVSIWNIIGVLAFLAIFIAHAGKMLGADPVIFHDEETYLSSTFKSRANLIIPNYLFYAIYGITDKFGVSALDGARILNALIFCLSAFFVYKIAKLACSPRMSVLIAFLTLLLPYSSFTNFFMPEIPYYVFFWGFMWFVMTCRNLKPWQFGLLAGAALGVLALIKTHAAFLCPGLAIFMLATAPKEKHRAAKSFFAIACAAAAFLAAKLSLGYILAGSKGLTLMGSTYGGIALEVLAGADIRDVIGMALYSFAGNLFVLAIPFGLPVTLAAYYAFARLNDEGETEPLRRLSIAVLSFLTPVFLVTAAYTAMTQLLEPYTIPPEVTNLHSRYYGFILPAFLIITGYAGAMLARDRRKIPSSVSWACIIPAALAVFGVAAGLSYYKPYPTICPELGPLFYGHIKVSVVFLVLVIVPCFIALFSIRRAIQAYLFVCLPVYCLATMHYSIKINDYNAARCNFSKNVGIYLKETLGEETSNLAIYDPTYHRGGETKYHVGDENVILKVGVKREVTFNPNEIMNKWLLFFIVPNTFPPNITYMTLLNDAAAPEKTKGLLIRTGDFDYSVNFAGGNHWPVWFTTIQNDTATAVYHAVLPQRIALELDVAEEDAAKGAVYDLVGGADTAPVTIARDGEGRYRVEIETEDGQNSLTLMKKADDDASFGWPRGITVTSLSGYPDFSKNMHVVGF